MSKEKDKSTYVDLDRFWSKEPGTYMSINTWTAERAYQLLENHSKTMWLSLHQFPPNYKKFKMSPTYYQSHWGIPKNGYYRAFKEMEIAGFFKCIENKKHYIFYSAFSKPEEKQRQRKYSTDNFIRLYSAATDRSEKSRLLKFYKKVLTIFIQEENENLDDKELKAEVEKKAKEVLEKIKMCSTSSDTSSSTGSSPSASNKLSEEGREESNGIGKFVSDRLVSLINKQWR